MLKRNERLTRAQFSRSFSVGKRSHSPTVQLIAAPSETFHGSVVVGKKTYKKAVDRNRLRRKLYAFLYTWNKKRNSKGGTYIVVAKPLQAHNTAKSYISDLSSLLEKNPGL